MVQLKSCVKRLVNVQRFVFFVGIYFFVMLILTSCSPNSFSTLHDPVELATHERYLAPKFSLSSLNFKIVSLSNYVIENDVVLLYFWASLIILSVFIACKFFSLLKL